MQSNFGKRDSLRREDAYKLEVFCTFRLVSQANCDCRIVLYARDLRVLFFLPLIEV
jgi:hypothetical protein